VAELLLGLAQVAIAIILSAVAAYLAFFLFQWFTRGLDEGQALQEGNVAVGVVLGAMLVSVAIVLRPALALTVSSWDVGNALFFQALMAQALQLAVGLFLAVLTVTLALYLFSALTRGINEVEELKKGNLSIAGLLAGVVIGAGLMVSQAVAQIMDQVASLLF
jgi:uncharacterized membrane protein YjfL (UPF0719 family)